MRNYDVITATVFIVCSALIFAFGWAWGEQSRTVTCEIELADRDWAVTTKRELRRDSSHIFVTLLDGREVHINRDLVSQCKES